jgi:CheY-like chemotaxis protein
MVQEFVLRSGAGLAVDSRLGEGTAFRLLMPLGGVGLSGNEGSEIPVDGRDGRLLRVLLVDDDARVRDSVGRLLLEGMLLAFAENGAEAVAVLRRDPDFDLVVSDLAMPMLDGVDLWRPLLQARPELPVILMTGQDPSLLKFDELPHRPIVLRKPIARRDPPAALCRSGIRARV